MASIATTIVKLYYIIYILYLTVSYFLIRILNVKKW